MKQREAQLALQRAPRTLLLSTAVATLGGLLFGFDTAVIAGTTQALAGFFHLSPGQLGFTVSCAVWGTVLGCLLASAPSEWWGGRACLRITAVLYFVSALGCSLAHGWPTFLVFRLLGGVAIGGCSIFGPMYIAETAPAAVRGKLVGCFQLSIVVGILVAYLSNYLLSLAPLGGLAWRADLGVAMLPALLFFLALGSIPRSPRWLLKKGLSVEARHSLARIGSRNPEREAEQIVASLEHAARQGRVTASVFSPAYRRTLAIALALGFFNQFSGINAILYYLNDIFARAGFAGVSAGRQAVAVGCANLLFTLLGMALIDRIGRKPLLIGGALGMALCLAGVAHIFLSGAGQPWLLPLLLGFIACFAASQGAVVWVYLSEVFPNAVREQGQSLASAWLWLLTAVVAGGFPRLAARSSGYPFVLFAATMVLQCIVVLWAFPETKGRTLEEGAAA